MKRAVLPDATPVRAEWTHWADIGRFERGDDIQEGNLLRLMCEAVAAVGTSGAGCDASKRELRQHFGDDGAGQFPGIGNFCCTDSGTCVIVLLCEVAGGCDGLLGEFSDFKHGLLVVVTREAADCKDIAQL